MGAGSGLLVCRGRGALWTELETGRVQGSKLLEVARGALLPQLQLQASFPSSLHSPPSSPHQLVARHERAGGRTDVSSSPKSAQFYSKPRQA